MILAGQQFRELWFVDFEFRAPLGERPTPVCAVARELGSGRLLRLWRDELEALRAAPFDVGPDAIFVAFFASAELSCFLRLGWPLPVNVLDLFCEFRNRTNGLPVPCGNGLLGALAFFGLDGIDTVEKDSMRQLAMRNGDHSAEERQALLDYCQTDVDALPRLLKAMAPTLDVPRALIRGRFMAAVARIEYQGTPVDLATLERLRTHWPAIQERLIERIDADYRIYDGRTFKRDRFAAWLCRADIPWPRLPSGELDLCDATFRTMANTHPSVAPIRELRTSLSKMRLSDLAVGSDGRNRCMLSPFQSRTGRNQPSNSQFIFGPATWLRSLIQSEPGYGVAYIDWCQQEHGIAAALSGDSTMRAAYLSGDPYLAFAIQAGAAPPDATKATHSGVRELYKATTLAIQYGMGAESLAVRLDRPEVVARDLLRRHRETYSTFWRWSDGAADHAYLHGWLQTVFGWTVHTGPQSNPRSMRNFPMQANGAEMLRLACISATERGVRVCAPVHDALLIEAPLPALDEAVHETHRAMADASRLVLDGFELRTDAELVRHPDRYTDKRGRRMWQTVMAILADIEGLNLCCDGTGSATNLCCDGTGTCAPTAHPYSLMSY